MQRQRRGNNGAAAMDTVAYDGYGKHLADIDSATGAAETYTDPVGFGGQYGYYTDPETELSLLTHRYYDSGTGRFVSRDPIGYEGGLNLYGYAGDNPVNDEDPEGTNWFTKLLGRIFIGKATGPSLFPNHPNSALSAKEMEEGGVPLAQRDPQQAGQQFRTGMNQMGQSLVGAAVTAVTLPSGGAEGDVAAADAGEQVVTAIRTAGFKGFRGMIQNSPLRDLTDTEMRKALEGIGLKPTNHFVMQLLHERTEAMGMRTLNDFRQMLRYGRVDEADESGIKYMLYGRLKIVFNGNTGKLISLVPR